MIQYAKGNLLDAQTEALVNTVNTVGIMGKGIALMFKERFPQNMREYAHACKAGLVVTGKMFVTETRELVGPRWIVNFPTKQHWRHPSRMEWVEQGLEDLRRFIVDNRVASIAIPPLGAGNGGLNWLDVKPRLEAALGDLKDVSILIYEPTVQYHNVRKQPSVIRLTPARAMIAELVRRYWILGMECTLLEIQKLAWFLQREIEKLGLKNELNLNFEPKNYGPYAQNLQYLLNILDGTYLKADKRIPDCQPFDIIVFNDQEKENIDGFLQKNARDYLPALEGASQKIRGFESPFGLELLATVDWLLTQNLIEPTVVSLRAGLERWPAGEKWAQRKCKLFTDKHLEFALEQLQNCDLHV
jgi:O-acetyl-ADP-ribose deacetylase (regulator of RNase III)